MSVSKEDQVVDASDEDRDQSSLRARRIIWFSVAVVASLLSLFLSWPWWRDFSYWAESRPMWAIYFVVGFVLAIYVFYAFFGSLRTLFEHDAIERAELAAESEAGDAEDRP